MEKINYNGRPALKESVSHKKAEASMIISYVSEEARDSAEIVPTKEELVNALEAMPSMLSE